MSDEFSLYEQKTGKRRVIKVNAAFRRHILDCHKVLNIEDDCQPCFLTRLGTIPSIQLVNQKLKEVNVKYRLRLKNISTFTSFLSKSHQHPLQKTAEDIGRFLSHSFNHITITLTTTD